MRRTPYQSRLVIFLLVALAGCSLKEYEDRIDQQQRRIAVLDEETRFLSSDAIDEPQIETKDGGKRIWPFRVFFRLPTYGTAKPQAGVYTSNGQELRLTRYAGGNSCFFLLAAAQIAEKEKDKEKDKGKDNKGKDAAPTDFTIDAFRMHVREALMDYYRKEYKVQPEFPMFERAKFQKISRQPITDRGDPPPPIDYEAIAFTDTFNKGKDQPARFDAYFAQQYNRQTAIIIQCPLSMQADDELKGSLDWSLKSLVTGPAAPDRREALYARRK